MKNLVQLIAYADRFGGGTIPHLHALLTGPLSGVFGGVHLLPFFDSVDGADAGFDPVDHLRVDPKLGGWQDVAALARDIDVMADVIVNHISSESPQFADHIAHGDASPYNGLFLTQQAIFPNGITSAEEAAIYRPRPGPPFTSRRLSDGTERLFWTTFTPQQIDIDVRHPQGRAYLEAILGQLAANGVGTIRLDAVGYAIKKPGTRCFMLPETFDFIAEFTALARAVGLEVLVEVHSHYREQIAIAKQVDRVYDFALPPLVLHAIFFKTAQHLKHWIAIRPTNALTVLDTHDGIGIIDIGSDAADRDGRPGLVPPAELDELVERIHVESRGESREATGTAASNLDLYQVNCSIYDALGRDDRAYLIARAIQFFLPGVPQVYYVGLLAGTNDMKLLAQSGVGRDINRHRFTQDEVMQSLNKPVVQQLIELIRLRNTHPAFGGSFALDDDDDASGGGSRRLSMHWTNGSHRIRLAVDFETMAHTISFGD